MGMVGSALMRALKKEGFTNLIFRPSSELDLRNQLAVSIFFEQEKPEYVFLAAARAGGIQANNIKRATFIYDNLMIQSNVIHQSHIHFVKKLLFLGSSCIYPKLAPQPIKEEYLLTSELEPTNEPYAISKIAGIKMCESYRRQFGCNFISVMPTNLYGPNDNYDEVDAHVLPALIKKFHTAKVHKSASVEVWGSGTPFREFLHADDLASACLFLMMNYNEEQFLNIGSGQEISIRDLASLVQKITNYQGNTTFNTKYPDGTPRKLLDSAKLRALGWAPGIPLEEGLARVYDDIKDTFT